MDELITINEVILSAPLRIPCVFAVKTDFKFT